MYKLLFRTTNGNTEFDFDTDKYDILIRATIGERSNSGLAMTPESEYSLRVSIAHLTRMWHSVISIVRIYIIMFL